MNAGLATSSWCSKKKLFRIETLLNYYNILFVTNIKFNNIGNLLATVACLCYC